jgi:hypothetical protein
MPQFDKAMDASESMLAEHRMPLVAQNDQIAIPFL